MPDQISAFFGWIPAMVFPTATAIQLLRLLVARSVAGVSITTWMLFGLANVGLYIYSGKYAEVQSILAMLLTAILDFAIVVVVLVGKRSSAAAPRAPRR